MDRGVARYLEREREKEKVIAEEEHTRKLGNAGEHAGHEALIILVG